jgi:hypothetical protein
MISARHGLCDSFLYSLWLLRRWIALDACQCPGHFHQQEEMLDNAFPPVFPEAFEVEARDDLLPTDLVRAQ